MYKVKRFSLYVDERKFGEVKKANKADRKAWEAKQAGIGKRIGDDLDTFSVEGANKSNLKQSVKGISDPRKISEMRQDSIDARKAIREVRENNRNIPNGSSSNPYTSMNNRINSRTSVSRSSATPSSVIRDNKRSFGNEKLKEARRRISERNKVNSKPHLFEPVTVSKSSAPAPTPKSTPNPNQGGIFSRTGKYVKGSFTMDALRKGSLGQRGVQGAALLTAAGGLYGAKKLYDRSKNK